MGQIPSHIAIQDSFRTIQGEGINSGRSTTFIRVLGCNLRCEYCDTGYRPQDNVKFLAHQLYTRDELIKRIQFLDSSKICFTGGEPLSQAPFLNAMIAELDKRRLIREGQTPFINFETNGTILIDKPYSWRAYYHVCYTMDIKPHEYERFKETYHKNLVNLKPELGDEVKIVITSEADLVFADEIINNYPHNEYILSPVTDAETQNFFEDINNLVADYVMNVRKRPNVRVGIQMHKLLGVK